MPICIVLTGYSVNSVARNVLTTAERSEQVCEIKAKTLFGSQCFANIKVLDKGIAFIVVFKVRYDPTVERFYLFGIGVAVCTNFVSKFFRLRIPKGCTAVAKIRSLRFADEIVCCDQRDQNECRYRQYANFRHETVLAGTSYKSTEIQHLKHKRNNRWESNYSTAI